MKVLHVFDHSLPHHSGYAFRSASILRALNARGIETVHLTSPKHVHDGVGSEIVDGLEFRRCPRVISGGSPFEQYRCVRDLRDSLKPMIVQTRPDVVHCHSPCLNGLSALGLGVPVVYEVRACWEDAAVSSGTTSVGSMRYRASRALETIVARRADQLVVICQGLEQEFIDRGLDRGRIQVVGNAVNPDFAPAIDPAAVERLRESLRLTGRRIIGFFGSFYDYEGLGLLVECLPAVLRHVPETTVLLGGGGEAEAALRSAVSRLGLNDRVRFLGRVPNSRIGEFHSLVDVMVFPRLKDRLTDMVTPLKPLEAMYLRRPVVASDVGGHRELVRHEDTGLLFEAGSQRALTQQLLRILNDPAVSTGLADRAHQYVMNERLWPHMAARYAEIYERLADPQRHGTAVGRGALP